MHKIEKHLYNARGEVYCLGKINNELAIINVTRLQVKEKPSVIQQGNKYIINF